MHVLLGASGHSIQQAEMNAAKEALEKSKDLFPQLSHQKKVILNTANKTSGRSGSEADPSTEVADFDKSQRISVKSFVLSDFPKSSARKKSTSHHGARSSSRNFTRNESRSRSRSRSRSSSSCSSSSSSNSSSSSADSSVSDVDQESKSSKSSGELSTSSNESDETEEVPVTRLRKRSASDRI